VKGAASDSHAVCWCWLDWGEEWVGRLSSKLELQFAGKPLAYLGRRGYGSMHAMIEPRQRECKRDKLYGFVSFV
jgi:hypothetical protein